MGIVFGIVTRHHGEIALDSAEGNGTTVAILLPVVTPAEKETAAGRPGIPSKRAERRNVLIVDDSDVNRDLFEGYLEPLGVRTLTAGSGREALSILEKEPVDLVVTDLSMPQMSGWQVAERAKALHPGLPVGLVSGWAVQQEEAQVKNSGIDFVLQKPCTMRQFQDAVVKALAGVVAAGR
jgi:CheY-like chemotaxis protein